MKKLDFEKYALEKSMLGAMPKSWQDSFWKYMNKKSFEISDIKFLDYGCGDGRYYNYLIDRGALKENIFGTEVSKIRIDRCKELGWENCFLTNFLEPLPFEDNFFDVISMVEVVEYIPKNDIDFYIKEIKRVLKPNGLFILTTPNYPIKRFYDIWDAFFGKKWARLKDDPTHVTLYNQRKMIQLLNKYFSTIEMDSYKDGFLYKRFKNDFFIHKMMVASTDEL
jgi:SAM-dependent methyltransferase